MGISLPTLDTLDVTDKTVLLRADLNVPMKGGRITDDTRITRLLPTIRELISHKARVVILSHFDRPEGKYVPSMSLAPLVDALSAALGQDVAFGVDCVGISAQETVSALPAGGVALMENLRFHTQEELGEDEFAAKLAFLGDCYVNDAFSCSHRAHASISGIPKFLPHAAGRLMQEEVETLDRLFSNAEKPMAAIVGGAKVSSKLALLEHLASKVDTLIIGGAMANTFLYAQGVQIGASLYEPKLTKKARQILDSAGSRHCNIILPIDAVVSETIEPGATCEIVGIHEIPKGSMIIDIGPESVFAYAEQLKQCKTVVWNGPLGAFETPPFDNGTVATARLVAKLTRNRTFNSIAGGGDTVSAIAYAGLTHAFTYLSPAGGAFLEWLQGKTLPGVAALLDGA